MLEINNLAFAGGGVKVIAYAGALKALKDKDCLKNVQKVVGASGGAIAAFSIALGYQPEEIEDILKKIDFNKFSDHTSKWDEVYNLVFYGGLNSEKYLEEFLGQLLKDKGFDPDITFKQLHDSQKTNIDLYVVCTNLSTQFPEILSYENAPDEKVVKFVHASGAFPIYFQPVQKTVQGVVSTYVDGGVTNNYPVEVFDDKTAARSLPQTDNKNYKTLGFKPINKEILEAYQNGTEPKPFVDTTTVVDQLYALAEVLTSSDLISCFQNHDRTVFIDDHNISALSFDITAEQKEALINSGYSATCDYVTRMENIMLAGLAVNDSNDSLVL